MRNLAGVLQIDRRQSLLPLRLLVSCRKLQKALLDVRIGLVRKIPHHPCAVRPELIGQHGKSPNIGRNLVQAGSKGKALRRMETNVECDVDEATGADSLVIDHLPAAAVGRGLSCMKLRGSSIAARRTVVARRSRGTFGPSGDSTIMTKDLALLLDCGGSFIAVISAAEQDRG
jgi:hypothetical protein